MACQDCARLGKQNTSLKAEMVQLMLADRQCAARAQGTPGGIDPAECDWPMCGCDPHATKVIEALSEAGALKE